VTLVSKSELRQQARQRRKSLEHAGIGAALASHAAALKLELGAIVGGYHALPDEADPALLLKALMGMGCHIAFPRIIGKDKALDFHLVPADFYEGGAMLAPGAHGIHEPSTDWPQAIPDLLLVPLLAFDAEGHRLGYGGGFYDRTIQTFCVPAIGVAYSGQEVASLPAEPHDMALDGILTELGFRAFS
jgi:5-formyltetrahydrofolate cyclo-ligase